MDQGSYISKAITKAEADKVAKHEKACIKNQHVFVPFAFDTFGALAPDAVRFLKRVQHSNTAHVKGQNFVFSRVGGFMLCSTEGPEVDFKNPINPIDV
ncbi:putative putrescine N-methyltransferase [Helianthus debilis subsp. tardiflorus]